MLGIIRSSLKHLMTRWSPFFRREMPIISSGLCSIDISSQQIAFAINPNLGKNNLDSVFAIQLQKKIPLSEILTDAINQYDLKEWPCSLVLQPDEYQLLLLDNPPVSKSEFQAAIRWKIVNLLSFPIDDAIIDHFLMPLQKTHNPRQMILVAVSRKSFLQSRVRLLREAGLYPVAITIQELALRNISALYEKDQKGTAFIYLENYTSKIIITCGKCFYFQRDLGVPLLAIDEINGEGNNTQLNEMALQIQRSFDYYQAQWRKALPARIFLAVSDPTFSIEKISHYLERRLGISFTKLDLNEVITIKQNISLAQQHSRLAAIGNALAVPDMSENDNGFETKLTTQQEDVLENASTN